MGTVFGFVSVWGRMRGREEIEWKDRAWRLLENKGELRTDWWTVGGAATGAVAGVLALRRGRIPVELTASTGMLGSAGVGMNAGVGYMFWSYANGRVPA